MNTPNQGNQNLGPQSQNLGTNNSVSIDSLTQEKPTESNSIQIPEISLPKGGGALKGIDEKFEVNAANGTAGFSIPLPITPGRNNFSPTLTLSYNSGSGNSPYGLGWSIDYPMIQRKTDRLLPRYLSGEKEDIFTLSGMEDLMPFLEESAGDWIPKVKKENGFIIKQYRPRIEEGFSRIEQIKNAEGEVYWKLTSLDNKTIFYGISASNRLADPSDETRIYAWLPELSYDDKGNWIRYEFKSEDLKNVTAVLHEKNRIANPGLFTNHYLKRICYGNHQAYYSDSPYMPTFPAQDSAFFFEVVMDYGEHELAQPTPQESRDWEARPDAFSSYRSGFEIRTYRRCQRILMFHRFEELGENPCLVRSLDLSYSASSINDSQETEVSYLKEICQKGYIRREDGTYSVKSLPPISFEYQNLSWNTRIQNVEREQLIHAPTGLSNTYRWVDLYGEGIPGILTEQAEGLYYKNNWGDVDEDKKVRFGAAHQVSPKPSFQGMNQGTLSVQDLEANGEKQMVVNQSELQGYFQITEDNDFQAFHPFQNYVNVNLSDPNIRMLDLNGDGKPELLMTEEQVFVWYVSEGKKGYSFGERSIKAFDEEKGPSIVFADTDRQESILLADMSGDGLTDIVRVRNGEICYWPNMGYGKFGVKVNMSNAPIFDHPDLFNPQYLQLADISGTGATDIVYLSEKSFRAYINLSGNAWSQVHEIESFLPIHSNSPVSVIDLMGTGTSCIVWSSDLPEDRQAPMKYIDLMDSKKPHVMIWYANNLGKETFLEYKSSTFYYLKDKLTGKPWSTKLPFPVQVISKMTVEEHITQVRFSTEYSYHHGYYDHGEREFRGFGRVEQLDTEWYENWKANHAETKLEQSEELYQAPVLTKTWFHTGAFLDKERILNQFEREYWSEIYNETFPDEPLSITEPKLIDAIVVASKKIVDPDAIENLSIEEWREALRACKGMMLRQEIFAIDGKEEDPNSLHKQAKPYSVATHNCQIQLLQPRSKNPYAVFLVTESEALTLSYERNEKDPRIAHSLNIEIDELGQILEVASVVYPRQQVNTGLPEEVRKKQAQTLISYVRNEYTHDFIEAGVYRLRALAKTETFELSGIQYSGPLFHVKDFKGILQDFDSTTNRGTTEIPYHLPVTGTRKRRLIEYDKTLFYDEYLSGPLNIGELASHGISYESYQLAFTPELLQDIYSNKILNPSEVLGQGKYVEDAGNWWIRSGSTQFLNLESGETLSEVKDRFFSPLSYTDPFGSVTSVSYFKDYFLLIESIIDAVENQLTVEQFNFRSLSPTRMRDINENLSEVLLDELGLVKALVVMGKGNEADDLQGLTEITEQVERDFIKQYFTLSDTAQLRDSARQLLQHATVRFVYDFDRYKTSVTLREEQLQGKEELLPCEEIKFLPTVVGNIQREQHHQENPNSAIQLSFEYTDGMGNVAMAKAQAEPGEAFQLNFEADCSFTLDKVNTGEKLRWIGNGRTILNNKGNPVKQYEPYFSVNPFYEDAKELVERGVSPIMYYDSIGRNIRTVLPDGTFTKVEFDTWQQLTYDQNDTVRDSQWYRDRGSPDPDDPSYDKPTTETEILTAWKAAQHHATPSQVHVDTLGRPVYMIEHNRKEGVDEFYPTRIDLDIEGNVQAIVDARNNTVMTYKYDILGNRVYQLSMDAGARWSLNNVEGNPFRSWDSRGHLYFTSYDDLQRPVEIHLQKEGDTEKLLIESNIYGENQLDASLYNLKGEIYQQLDGEGQVTNVRFDFKGNPIEMKLQVAAAYDAEVIDWSEGSASNALEEEIFTKSIEFDALNRMSRQYNWHRTNDRVTVYDPVYNERQVLVAEDHTTAAQRTASGHTGGRTITAVSDIKYNEKGQRVKMRLSNGTVTRYYYDEKMFRLIQLRTTRGVIDGTLPSAPSNLQDANVLQNLYYSYDAVGNITEIEDDAFEPVFFRNQIVKAKSRYSYDALYRLIKATGRENNTFDKTPNRKEPDYISVNFPRTDQTLRNYTQNYDYDAVGNMLSMQHISDIERWTRTSEYEANSNRLYRSWTGSNPDDAVIFGYDDHGNMLNYNKADEVYLPQWEYRDMVYRLDLGGGGDAFYQYTGDKKRIRKRVERIGGQVEERFYLGGFEWYRRWQDEVLLEEIETHHLFVDDQRILLVEDIIQTDHPDLSTGILDRFQYSNHLGSVGLEMNGSGDILSYEEYHPYGTLAYHASSASIKTKAKRYRFTGMERDEESGLNYHTARYYLPWLGRWMSADPIDIEGGMNVYAYAANNPIRKQDKLGNQPMEQMHFYEAPVYHTNVTATYSSRGISQDLRYRMTGVYRLWTGDYTSKVDVGHMGKPFVFLRSGEVSPVGPQLASENRSDGGGTVRNQASAARRAGEFTRTDGKDMTPSGLASKGRRNPQNPLSPALRDPKILAAGKAQGPPGGGSQAPSPPVASTPPKQASSSGSTPQQMSFSFMEESAPESKGGKSANSAPKANTPKPGPAKSGSSKASAPKARPSKSTVPKASSAKPSISSTGSSRRGGPKLPQVRPGAVSALGTLGAAVVPGVVEAEVVLMGSASVASQYAVTAPLVTPLVTAAEAVPVAAGVGVVGAATGHAVRATASALGASEETSDGVGFVAAVATGAALGSVIPGVGTAVGAGIGAATAGVFYLFTL